MISLYNTIVIVQKYKVVNFALVWLMKMLHCGVLPLLAAPFRVISMMG